ncbi:MAG: YerC/YecD family TrpR-related protein [Pseudomonadota bacterium]
MKPDQSQSAAREEALESLFAIVSKLDTVEDCRNLLRDLCTPSELEALADRWQAAMYVDSGLPYREIHERTGVSVTTIGRVARFLNDGFGGYRAALDMVPAVTPEQDTHKHPH